MHRPIPSKFDVSLPPAIMGQPWLDRCIERAVGGSALVLALAAFALTISLSSQSSRVAVVIACAVLLYMAYLGHCLKAKLAALLYRNCWRID